MSIANPRLVVETCWLTAESTDIGVMQRKIRKVIAANERQDNSAHGICG